ncbi:B3 domain-containing transcription factor vrn1 [Thalictrum thalictroides]|uniref:B3 domain-containing transcription factor vrn1 n=1 Tax=Thalictrum thalictroides TaxID=46969 RepID=A0A7J6VZD2_THATH|nr:B3 domain-containing transcription factor vrn1 [Thalictrum thalictroides]
MQKSKIKEEQCYQRTREEKGKGSHFFKIIHSSCIQDRRLVIPKKFIRNFGKELANVVVLKVPSKKHWEVELVEDEGQVWFQNDWQRFMEYHSISVGHFLVFRYDGNSQFSVVILDTTASEIEYLCDIDGEPSMLTKNSNHEQEHVARVRYNEGPRELMDCQDNYPLSSPPCMPRPRSDDLHHMTNNKGPVESSSLFLYIGVHSNIRKNTSILQVHKNAQAELVHGPRRLVSIREKGQPDLVAARAFTSENPF